MFRTTVTYAVPKLRSTAIGETRITATSVPMISAPIAESTVSLIVTQNAAGTSYSAEQRPQIIHATSRVERAGRGPADWTGRPRR